MKAVWVTLLLAACANGLEPVSRVSGFRILATRADKPFAAPGESVQLETLAVDGQGRPFQMAWTSCDRPPSSSVVGCVNALAGRTDVELTQGPGLSTYSVTIAPDALQGVPPLLTRSLYVGVVQVACPGEVLVAQAPEGLPLRCNDANGEALTLGNYDLTVKRIFVRQTDRNANPTIDRVTFNGEEWKADDVRTITACDSADSQDIDKCEGGDKLQVAVEASPDSFESGTSELNEPFAEQVLAQYYATDGLFTFNVREASTPQTEFKARAGAKGTTAHLWFVVRDDRGGVAWTARQLQVAP